MYTFGIDFGGTNIAVGLVDEAMTVIDKMSMKTNVPRSISSMIDDMVIMLQTLQTRNHLKNEDIKCVGVGVPCTANESNGHMEDADNLGFEDVEFRDVLQARSGFPVYIDNDANAAAWGEYMTGDYTADSMIMITLGTGIGGGIILDGHLWKGINYSAGEFGHMVIYDNGVPCNCGRTGCFEAYGSASALTQQAKKRMQQDDKTILRKMCGNNPDNMEAKLVFDGAREMDAACMELLDNYTTYLAEGIANIINIFQPAYVCIGGGISNAGTLLLDPVQAKVANRIYSRNAAINTQIVLAKLKNDAGIIGAALLGSRKGRGV